QVLAALAAESVLAGGTNPRVGRRAVPVVLMVAGAALGVLLMRHGLTLPLAVGGVCTLAAWVHAAGTDQNLHGCRMTQNGLKDLRRGSGSRVRRVSVGILRRHSDAWDSRTTSCSEGLPRVTCASSRSSSWCKRPARERP